MTRIGPTVVINGELISHEDVTIDGRVDGRISVRDGTLVINEHAQVVGDVRSARIQVRGKVRGGLSATERIELQASASVKGNLSAGRIVIVDGARFDGGVDMDRRTIAAKVAQYKAAVS